MEGVFFMTSRVSHMLPTNTSLFQNSPSEAESGIAELLERVRKIRQLEEAAKSYSFSREALQEDTIWGNGLIDEVSEELRPYQRAISQVVESTLMHYCPKMESVLEIGSGTHPIIEYLLHLPQECKNRIHLSDFREERLNQIRVKHPLNNASLIDVKRLSDNLAQNSHQCIIMHDVLNTFFKKEIETSCGEIYKTLKPEGYFIHFSTREAIYIDTLDEFKRKDLIYFPLLGINYLWEGITVFDLSEFKCYANSLGPRDHAVKKFLLEYADLNSSFLDQLCCDSCFTNYSPAFATITKCVEEWHCPSARKVLFEDHFHKKLERVLKDSGFCIKKCENVSGCYTGPRTEIEHGLNGGKHLFSIDRINRTMYYNGVLAPGLIQEKANVHVIVAQKV
jgi:hypothetical protein